MSSLKNIASACGKDVSTVSRALRDDPRVKETTREEIKAVAEAMGYAPNLAARSLRVGSSRTVWFFLPTVSDPLTQLATEYAAGYLREAGYDLLLAVHSNQEPIFARLLSRLEQGVCDAAIIIQSGHLGETQLSILAERNYPIAFLDRHMESCAIPVFTTDNRLAARQLLRECVTPATEAVVALFGGNTVEDARLCGMEEEAAALGLPLLKRQDFKPVSASDSPGRLVILGSSQGVVCRFFAAHNSVLANRHITFGVFDEWVGEPYPAEKACICKQDFEAMSKKAVDYLLEMMEHHESTGFRQTTVPHRQIYTVKPSGS